MKYALIPVMLLCLCFVAGCSYLDEGAPKLHPANLSPSFPAPESRTATVEPSAMALQLSDLPDGYIIKERSDVVYADLNPLARDEGWKKGYYVAFYRMDVRNYDITGISQQISIYPLDRVRIIFDDVKTSLQSRANTSVTVTELPFPKTGDRTIALRTVNANDPYGIMTYTLVFTKKDVLEQIEMRGTTTDYEVMKDIAARAAQKIR
jgi:hypothetical protein